MSMKELYGKVAADSGLQVEFAAIMQNAEKNGKEATEEKLIAFAKKAGFAVSVDEFKAYMNNGGEKPENGELSDDDLDMVAGGKIDISSVFGSVLTLGISCGIASAVYSMDDKGCGGFFQE